MQQFRNFRWVLVCSVIVSLVSFISSYSFLFCFWEMFIYFIWTSDIFFSLILLVEGWTISWLSWLVWPACSVGLLFWLLSQLSMRCLVTLVCLLFMREKWVNTEGNGKKFSRATFSFCLKTIFRTRCLVVLQSTSQKLKANQKVCYQTNP